MMISFDTSPLRMNVIAAYAPHAGKSKDEKRKFYKELSDVLDSIPNHEINIILENFNVRLMERLLHEVGVLGSTVSEMKIVKLNNSPKNSKRTGKTLWISVKKENMSLRTPCSRKKVPDW